MPAWLLTLLAKMPGYALKLYKSKAFWPSVTTGGILGATALGEAGKAGERKMTREQLALQTMIQKAAAEATKKQVDESRMNTDKYIKEMVKVQKANEARAREDALMQSFMESQNRQLALTMQALGGMTAGPSNPGAGTFGVMRQGY